MKFAAATAILALTTAASTGSEEERATGAGKEAIFQLLSSTSNESHAAAPQKPSDNVDNGRRRLKRNPTSSSAQQQQRRRQQSAQAAIGGFNLQQSSTQTTSSSAAPGCGPSSGTIHSPYLGCFTDKSTDRAFPHEHNGGLSNSLRFGHGALDCERVCSKAGYRYFGREFKGQCFCGNELERIVRHGRDEGCDCCGGNVGAGKMCVWEVSNIFESYVWCETKHIMDCKNDLCHLLTPTFFPRLFTK